MTSQRSLFREPPSAEVEVAVADYPDAAVFTRCPTSLVDQCVAHHGDLLPHDGMRA